MDCTFWTIHLYFFEPFYVSKYKKQNSIYYKTKEDKVIELKNRKLPERGKKIGFR